MNFQLNSHDDVDLMQKFVAFEAQQCNAYAEIALWAGSEAANFYVSIGPECDEAVRGIEPFRNIARILPSHRSAI